MRRQDGLAAIALFEKPSSTLSVVLRKVRIFKNSIRFTQLLVTSRNLLSTQASTMYIFNLGHYWKIAIV